MSEKKILNRIGIGLAVFVAIWIGLQLLLGWILNTYAPQAMEWEWMYWLISYGPMYLVAFPIILKLFKKLPSRQLFRHTMPKGHFLQVFIMTMGLMVIGNILGIIVTTILTNVTGIPFAVDLADTLLDFKLIWVFLITVIIAPIVEEIVFRKLLIDHTIMFGDTAAILISALCFGLMHGNFTQCFYTFGIGLMFAFIYVRTGKIKYCIGLHMVFNLVGGFLPSVFMKYLNLDMLEQALLNGNLGYLFDRLGVMLGFVGYELAVWAMGIAGIVLLIAHRKQFRRLPGEIQLSVGQMFRTAVSTPGFWLWLAVTVGLFIINVI